MGVSLVQRPSGGRAILHHMELTYCVVAPIHHSRFPGNLRGTFRVIGETLLLCLRNLGVHSAVMSHDSFSRSGSRSPSCFSSLSHCEISVYGRKLIGSAQRRTHHAFLQHGSVIIECDRQRLNSFFLFKSPEARQKNLRLLQEGMITLNEVRMDLGFEDVRLAFLDGFRQSFTEGIAEGKLTPLEVKLRDSFLESILL